MGFIKSHNLFLVDKDCNKVNILILSTFPNLNIGDQNGECSNKWIWKNWEATL